MINVGHRRYPLRTAYRKLPAFQPVEGIADFRRNFLPGLPEALAKDEPLSRVLLRETEQPGLKLLLALMKLGMPIWRLVELFPGSVTA